MSEDGPEYVVDFRERPGRYKVGRGEEGTFKIQPYKDELLPLWTFETLEKADESAEAIHGKYEEHRDDGDFPWMDMARKYLQIGYTRVIRYARYPGGKKYVEGEERNPEEWADLKKRESALRFEERLECVREDEAYRRAKADHRER